MNDSQPAELFPPPPSTRWCGSIGQEPIGCLHYAEQDARREADYWQRTLRTPVNVIQMEVHNAQ